MQISKIVMTLIPTEIDTTKNESFSFDGPPPFVGDGTLLPLPVKKTIIYI